MRVAPLTTETFGAWAALLGECGGCYCRYWHFEGTKNAWLARCFEQPDESRREQELLVAQGSLDAHGLVALEQDVAVGWVKLAPRGRLAKLRRQGAYRPLDLGPDEGTWSVACLLVRRDRRRGGVARALVAAAEDHVRAQGARVLEAYPHRVAPPQHDEQVWLGPESIYAGLGYVAVHDVGPYPVLRKRL